MSEKTVRYTREQLYDLVWSKPMTAIAAEFGMSSVAFAKYCKAADVPRPERGYWQQLACGQKPSKPKLPKAVPGTVAEVVIERYQRSPIGRRRPPEDLQHVDVAERVHKFHPAVKELDELLRTDFRHQDMLAVRGFQQVVLKLGENSRKRALRLLHTLFGSVEKHGHQVRLRRPAETSNWQKGMRAVEIVVDGAVIDVSLREHLNRTVHQQTEQEKRWTFLSQKYDLQPSGNLLLELHIPWGTDTRTHWRDTEKERLEDLLGEMVWVVDEAARALVGHRERLAERERQAEIDRKVAEEKERERRRREAEEKRRQAEVEARARYQRAVERDLRRAAHHWAVSQQLRSFLDAVEEAVPATDRGEGFRGWLKWAEAYAHRLDPLSEPYKIAKVLDPDLEQLMAVTGELAMDDEEL